MKEKAKPSLKVPSQEVANSLEVLLENDQIGLVKDFLRPYQYLIPEFKVVRQDVSKEMTFVADWVVKLLKKENSKTHIEATTDYVNQLTLFGVTKPRADFLAFMQGFICVVSLGLAVPFMIKGIQEKRKLNTIRDDYMKFLDNNGHKNIGEKMEKAASKTRKGYGLHLAGQMSGP